MNLLPEAPSSTSNTEPLYNIGVVTRMTGITMATLRAWERRYDFPEAERTSGGHRLYSERDILRLRWVKSLIEEGMQTAQAIQALKHQEQSGTVIEIPGRQEVNTSPLVPEIAKSSLEIYKDQLFNCLVQRNLQKADHVLGEALVVFSPEDLIYSVIGPVLSSVGTAWENNEISIATEHLASNYLRQRLLMWMTNSPPSIQIPPIVLACAPEEWHEGSLLMLGAILRRLRYPVAYLGQSVPLADLASFTREIKPSVIVSIAMMENTAQKLLEWTQYLRGVAASGKPPFCYGGRIFSMEPEWQLRMHGIYLGNTIQEGVTTLEKIINNS